MKFGAKYNKANQEFPGTILSRSILTNPDERELVLPFTVRFRVAGWRTPQPYFTNMAVQKTCWRQTRNGGPPWNLCKCCGNMSNLETELMYLPLILQKKPV